MIEYWVQHYKSWITFGFIAYVLAAFMWWGSLLRSQTTVAYEAEVAAAAMVYSVDPSNLSGPAFDKTPQYYTLTNAYEKRIWMITVETIAIVAILIGWFILVYQTFKREVNSTEQQQNFLLSITHELKSPIAGIRLILETFQKRRELPEAMQEKLSTNGLRETDRLTALVEDLLLSAKLESGYQLNNEPLDLGEVIWEAADKVAAKYPSAAIDVRLEEDLPFIRADRLGITSVAINLIENAAKYSPEPAGIAVNLRRGGPRELVWTVADNGQGIPDEHKDRIWRKFYRIGSENTRNTKGTGLGLFIVKELVKRHGGHIEVVDNEPSGTKFVINLPTMDQVGRKVGGVMVGE